MRFPTILGLLLLIISLTLATFIYKGLQDTSNFTINPSDIKIANLTNNSVSIIWESQKPYRGKVLYSKDKTSQSKTISDSTETKLHFITLNNLEANSTYLIKVSQGLEFYSENVVVKTTSNKSSLKPITGVIIDEQLMGVDETLVTTILNGQEFASQTSNNGNYLLPLFGPTITTPTPLSIYVRKGSLQSRVDFQLPFDGQLPPIQLGKDLDLKDYLLTEQKDQMTKQTDKKNYDLNGDKKINSLDLSIVLQNFGKIPKDARIDFDGDNKVTQKDVNLIMKALQD